MAKSRAIARRRSKSMTVPVAVLAGFAPLASEVIGGYQAGGLTNAASRALIMTTGYNTQDGRWYPSMMVRGVGPIVLGVAVHKLSGRFGINRALANAGVPFLRI